MKKIQTLALAILLGTASSFAQLALPQPSPKASVMQTVGLTDITIDYSSPGVKGRNVWGDVVAMDKVWRAGANSATKITFGKDVMIGANPVAKGTYSIFMIPSKAEWTVIINKDANATEGDYKQESDVLRLKVTPASIASRERLVYLITDFTDEQATVSMEWEKVRVSFNVKVSTGAQAVENIDKAVGSSWGTYNNAARYYYDQKQYDKALGYVNTSIALSDQWFNNWVKAQILAAKGDNKGAYEHAAKAKELGDKNPQGFFFKPQVEKALNDWAAYAAPAKKKK